MPRAVIFDMDGVLVDSMHVHWLAWKEAFAAFGIDIAPEDFAKTPGMTVEPVIRLLGGERFTRAQIDDIIEKQEKAFQRILSEDFPSIPGVSKLIKSLDEAGWRMSVGTSGPMANLRLVLDHIPEGYRIKTYVVCEDVVNGKPDPEVFLKAAERMGTKPAETVVIEDSFVGLQAAKKGGFLAVALTTTHPMEELKSMADLVVDSLEKLSPEVLELLF